MHIAPNSLFAIILLCFIGVRPGLAALGIQNITDATDEYGNALEAREADPGFLDNLLGSLGLSSIGTLLSSVLQNGQSTWGTRSHQPLPLFKSGGGTTLFNGLPWGSITTKNTNPYTGQPNTGATR